MINRDPDIRFFIRYADAGSTKLIFHLLVRDPVWGPTSEEYGPSQLYTTPSHYQAELKKALKDVWKLAKLGGEAAAVAQGRIESIGTTLFQQLPENLQDRFWSLLGRASTLQIISDEPMIPWELMKLQKREPGNWQPGFFLCEAFAVTRWLHKMIGSLKLPIRDIALVVPQDSNLKEVKGERTDILSLDEPGRKVREITPTYLKVTEALHSGEHDAWHFCGHATANTEYPDRMIFSLLKGEQPLRPEDLNVYGEGLSRRQALVFLNACETGEGGFTLMNQGGWAYNILKAGAGAFLGTLWSVNDEVAREFAKEFYRRFLKGEPIAEALKNARLHVRNQIPGDPSWLAYTAFAHPFARAQEEQLRPRVTGGVGQKDPDTWNSLAVEEESTTAPSDLKIYVHASLRAGETLLEFSLDFPSGALGYKPREFSCSPIAGPPEMYRTRLIDRIKKLDEGLDVNDELLFERDIKSRLEGIGRNLYHDLFPPEVRQAYRSFRKHGRSIMFVTDESWIPWELIKPYDDSDLDDIIDDDFLCLRFPMTRWLASAHQPTEEIRIRRFAVLGGETFPHSQAEKQRLYELTGKHPGVEDVSPNDSTMAALEEFLDDGNAELLHFTGPFLERTFRPEDLHGPRATKIRRNRPLVFFNFDSGLTGWESRWIEACGCGAFLGLSWPPRDSLAYEFAVTFYDALGRGETFGAAALEARRRLYALNPSMLTWLAYTVYAHVNGRLVLGGSSFK